MAFKTFIRSAAFCLSITLPTLGFAASSSLPTQDIMVLSLKQLESGQWSVSKSPLHITYREGYDNQPKFSDDGSALFFTRMMSAGEVTSESMQTDIMRYDFENGSLTNITNTDTHSEYSATPYGNDQLSMIGVNPEGQQHLRVIDINNGEQHSLRTDIEPVGYHAWLNESQAAVFVLGEVMTLQVLDTEETVSPKVLASNIGRCFESVMNGVSFTQESEGVHGLFLLDDHMQISSLGIQLPKGVQDYVWLNNAQVISSDGQRLLLLSDIETKVLADLSSMQVKSISRLAFDPINQRLAVVYNR